MRVKNFKMSLVVVIGMILLGCVSAVDAATIYSDDFSSGTAAGWYTADAAKWSVSGGQYIGDSGTNAGTNSALSTVSMPSNWVYDMDMTILACKYTGGDSYYAGFSVLLSEDYTAPTTGSHIKITFQQSSSGMRILFYNGGTLIRAGNSSSYMSSSGAYHITVERLDGTNQINTSITYDNDTAGTVTINDAVVYGGSYYALDDLPYTGFRLYCAQDALDNLVITSTVPEPLTISLLLCGSLGVLFRKRRA